MDHNHRPQVKAMLEMRFYKANFGPQTQKYVILRFHICGRDLANKRGENEKSFQNWTYYYLWKRFDVPTQLDLFLFWPIASYGVPAVLDSIKSQLTTSIWVILFFKINNKKLVIFFFFFWETAQRVGPIILLLRNLKHTPYKCQEEHTSSKL